MGKWLDSKDYTAKTDPHGIERFWSYEHEGRFYYCDCYGNVKETDHRIDVSRVYYDERKKVWIENGKIIESWDVND